MSPIPSQTFEHRLSVASCSALLLVACGDFGRLPPPATDAGPPPDADAGPTDGGGTDSGPPWTFTCPPAEGYDAGTVSLAVDLQPTFSGWCLGACHSASAASAGEVLAPGLLYANVVGVPASQTQDTSGMNRVEPFDSDASYLVHKLQGTHLDPPALGIGSRMPLGYPECISPVFLATLRAWIAQGALDN